MTRSLITFYFIIIAWLFSSINIYGQVKQVKVEKVKCYDTFENVKNGYKLVVEIHLQDTVLKTPDTYYFLGPVLQSPDSVKLMVIQELLKFKEDDSRCCLRVQGFYQEGVEYTCKGRPKTRDYSIQIDALFMINKIVHPRGVSFYSCFPVVIDWKSKREINKHKELIMDYYSVYEKCLEKALQGTPIKEAFQFNTTKYAWYGARPETIVNE